jgi:hypothetical protein
MMVAYEHHTQPPAVGTQPASPRAAARVLRLGARRPYRCARHPHPPHRRLPLAFRES